jgi:hypothetical protein
MPVARRRALACIVADAALHAPPGPSHGGGVAAEARAFGTLAAERI